MPSSCRTRSKQKTQILRCFRKCFKGLKRNSSKRILKSTATRASLWSSKLSWTCTRPKQTAQISTLAAKIMTTKGQHTKPRDPSQQSTKKMMSLTSPSKMRWRDKACGGVSRTSNHQPRPRVSSQPSCRSLRSLR